MWALYICCFFLCGLSLSRLHTCAHLTNHCRKQATLSVEFAKWTQQSAPCPLLPLPCIILQQHFPSCHPVNQHKIALTVQIIGWGEGGWLECRALSSAAFFFLRCHSFQDGAHEIIQQDYVRHHGFCCVLSSVCPLYSFLFLGQPYVLAMTLHILCYCMSCLLK